MGIIDNIRESIEQGLSRVFRDSVRSIEKEILRNILIKVNRIKRQMIKELIAIFIILISIALLAASATFFLIEYMHLNKTLSFLIIGIIVLIIGILIKLIN